MFPDDRSRGRIGRSISGEIHSGFANLRSALPMNLKTHHKNFRIFAGAKPDIERIQAIWTDCLGPLCGPFLFGDAPTVADAMFAPVTRRFLTYRRGDAAGDRGLLRDDRRLAADGRMDRRRRCRAGGTGGARRRILTGSIAGPGRGQDRKARSIRFGKGAAQ